MGGRGASSGAGGGGGGFAKGELKLPDGSKIEFEGKLVFGREDKAVTGVVRQNITNWESKRKKNKIEYAYSVDANGNPIGTEVRGGKGSVRIPISMHDKDGATFTHIHPRGEGMLGGTFSYADMRNFANYKNKTVRAAAKEGTYSMSKSKNFDSSGFKSYASKLDSNFKSSMSTKAASLGADFRSKKISRGEYERAYAKAFNTALVEIHNGYLQGQKQYGYTYTLERS